ncbi:MAG: site-2 protease family protein [Syntrophales bacterium]|nr:site-2 protease family protein [Syntrophales bacterium]
MIRPLGRLPAEIDIVLHPIAFSGWIGLLVTSFNLLPVGQLDGGHVAYAVWGDRQASLAKIMFLILLILGLTAWMGWLLWAAVVYIMGLRHPPVVYDWIPLDGRRRVIGWVVMAIFALTFTPVPF